MCSGPVIEVISLFFIPFFFSYYTHQTVSTMSYSSIFLICIDYFNLCLEKERQQGRDRGLKKNVDGYRNRSLVLLPSSQYQWSVLKKGRWPWRVLVRNTSSPEDSNLKPMKLHWGILRELTQLLSEFPRMYGQARRREMHKCITKFIKEIWGGFCIPSSYFMFMSSKFLE